MKKAQRYLVAKYVPDMRRMEPVNIGVVLWCDGRTASRFVEPDEAHFVTDKKTYERWLRHWESLLAGSAITPIRGRKTPKEQSEFLDAFASTQKGNYLLVEGGEIIDKIQRKKLDGAAGYLFDQLVSRKDHWPSEPKAQAAQLRFECDRLFSDVGLSQREDFEKGYRVECKIGHATKLIPIHYAVANGAIASAFQRVNLSQMPSVGYATFVFEHALKTRLHKEHRIALVRSAAEAVYDQDTESSIAMLNEFATVVDLANYDYAREKIGELIEPQH